MLKEMRGFYGGFLEKQKIIATDLNLFKLFQHGFPAGGLKEIEPEILF